MMEGRGASGGNCETLVGLLVDHDALELGVAAQDVRDAEGPADEAIVARTAHVAVVGDDQTVHPALDLDENSFGDGAHI